MTGNVAPRQMGAMRMVALHVNPVDQTRACVSRTCIRLTALARSTMVAWRHVSCFKCFTQGAAAARA